LAILWNHPRDARGAGTDKLGRGIRKARQQRPGGGTMKPVAAIYRKELTDTLRDRKTLIFMLLVPTLLIPLLMFGLARLLTTMTKAEQTRPVVIVADGQSHRAYEAMVHQWFLGTEMGRGLPLFDAPILGAITRQRS